MRARKPVFVGRSLSTSARASPCLWGYRPVFTTSRFLLTSWSRCLAFPRVGVRIQERVVVGIDTEWRDPRPQSSLVQVAVSDKVWLVDTSAPLVSGSGKWKRM